MFSKFNNLYEFEDFRLDASNPSLWRSGKLVSIPPKALGALILLVTKKGEVVTREELLEKVWQETFVEEGNINYTISLLRKTLGRKDLIETVPRRGYRFAAEVREIGEKNESDDAHAGNRESQSPAAAAPVSISSSNAESFKRPKNKKRRLLFAVVLIFVLLLTSLFAFSWRRNALPSAGDNVETDPKSASLQAYRRGRMILDDKDVKDREQKALEEFQQSVTLDPASALAHAGLAEAYISKGVVATNHQSREFYAKAAVAVEKSFSLDANLFEAYLARGWLRRNGDWDWGGAEQDFRRALEIKPDSALAHFRYSQLLANIGRYAEALVEIKKADEIDPLSEVIINGHFPLLESAGEYEKALKLAEEYQQSNPENLFARRAVATFQYHMGDYAKVIETGEAMLANGKNRQSFAWLSLLAASYAKTGQPEKSEAMLRELEIQSHTDKRALYSLAMNYAETGRPDEAITALEECYEVREQRMMWVAVEPRFANLKNHPRFRQLLVKMRLN